LRPHTIYIGEKYISIGANSHIGDYGRLTAYPYYPHTKQTFSPEIIIGDNCSIGAQSHITAINKIVIGNNVLTGPRVLITDNAHGNSVDENEKLDIPPYKRELISNGSVIIEDNVWIGEGSMIMPNVYIGKGSIIAANSVVTKDIPPYSIAAGVPAKVIRTMTNQ
jgi:acetyltransferase-like isoleucine patch superfamily enzyme